MNDPAPPPVTPAKKPGLIRPAALWLLPLTAVVLIALVPLVLEPWLEGKVRAAAGLAGLEFAPETTIDVSVFGGRITITRLDLREIVDGKPRSLFTADRAELDADLLACLGGDIVLDSAALEGASGDLRRRGDGTIPLATPPPAERGGSDWGKLDWWSYARKSYAWQKGKDDAADAKISQKDKGAEPEKEAGTKPAAPADAAKPEKKPAHDWTGAHTYEPAPGPAGPATRVLIRSLRISGRELLLPDDTPFSITSFSITGANLGWGRREPGSTWNLDATAETRGAGAIELGLGTGRVRAKAAALPLAALAHPALAGDAIARHGASGTATVDIAATWQQALDGAITAKVSGLKLEPKEPTPREAKVAQVVNRLDGRPLDWTMKLGGTPQDPQVTDDGLEGLAKGSLADAAKGALIEEGGKRLDEQLQKNEKAKQASDKAKDLLKGWGK